MSARGETLAAATLALALCSCDAQVQSWGLDAIRTMKTPADDPSLACGVALPGQTFASQRGACTFGQGALPEATLGLGPATAAAIPIRHVIVMMKENRSFDHLLGRLYDQLPASYSNLDLTGAEVKMTHATTTCLATDPAHQSASMRATVDGGAMDGFVANAARTTDTDGHFVMTYYDATDFPFYDFLARTFALDDAHFASLQSGTFANRAFMMYGTNAGVVDTGISYPAPNRPSLLHQLMNAGFTWGAYSDGAPLSASLGWTHQDPGVHSLQDLLDALDQGTLPNVVFVDGIESEDDDHPIADIQKGEAWAKVIYDHAVRSPQWDRLAILWTYDEGGGFPDHVPPPTACQADPSSPFRDLGTRVPFVAISPWAKRGYVSHQVQDHTAITRFIEALFGLPALTARDANAGALLELFDFSCGRDLSVPPAPAAGTGGCSR